MIIYTFLFYFNTYTYFYCKLLQICFFSKMAYLLNCAQEILETPPDVELLDRCRWYKETKYEKGQSWIFNWRNNVRKKPKKTTQLWKDKICFSISKCSAPLGKKKEKKKKSGKLITYSKRKKKIIEEIVLKNN